MGPPNAEPTAPQEKRANSAGSAVSTRKRRRSAKSVALTPSNRSRTPHNCAASTPRVAKRLRRVASGTTPGEVVSGTTPRNPRQDQPSRCSVCGVASTCLAATLCFHGSGLVVPGVLRCQKSWSEHSSRICSSQSPRKCKFGPLTPGADIPGGSIRSGNENNYLRAANPSQCQCGVDGRLEKSQCSTRASQHCKRPCRCELCARRIRR